MNRAIMTPPTMTKYKRRREAAGRCSTNGARITLRALNLGRFWPNTTETLRLWVLFLSGLIVRQ